MEIWLRKIQTEILLYRCCANKLERIDICYKVKGNAFTMRGPRVLLPHQELV